MVTNRYHPSFPFFAVLHSRGDASAGQHVIIMHASVYVAMLQLIVSEKG